MSHQIALIGAEQEENLSLRYLAAALARAGFRVSLHRFDEPRQRERVLGEVLAADPLAVGISAPFQHRAGELLALAGALRERGYGGHITVGGHFATFEYAAILRDVAAVDSVVRHEGEQTLTELCQQLAAGREITALPGVVVRGRGGVRVGPRRRVPRLDELPFPDRRGEPHQLLGVRCAPIVGSRGCHGDCSFCCIHAYNDSARGPRYRRRSAADIVAEMKDERARRGVRLFVFHDDNFLVPRRQSNLARCRELHERLVAAGLDDVRLVVKCRPDDVDPELVAALQRLGVIRVYVGVESNSDEGLVSLNRRVTREANRRALRVLRAHRLYHSFNVLLFDPQATLAGVEQNLDFMEAHADSPFNFCRAEVYAGTPLQRSLARQGRLAGDYRGWSYEQLDPRVELLFRVAVTAFRGRNFKPDGLANLNMGLRFEGEVLRHFHPASWDEPLHARLVAVSRRLGRDSVGKLRLALAFAREVGLDDRGAANEFTLQLARSVAAVDLALLREIKQLQREITLRARGRRARRGAVHAELVGG